MSAGESFDVVVIGGGAAGTFAAGFCAQRGARTLLVEKNGNLGKKLLISGKGRCNITNIADIGDVVACYHKNGKFLYRAFREFFNWDLIEFFNAHGVKTKVERGGRVFPESDQASDVVQALEKHAHANKVSVAVHSKADAIVVSKDKEILGVRINAEKKLIKTAKVILATGGLSYPATGSTGDGYAMARDVGHTIVPLKPALVPLETKERFVKELQGLALKNVEVNVFSDGQRIAGEFGEMLFTHFGVSGPVILTISGGVAEELDNKKTVEISINMKPALDLQKLDKRLLRDFETYGLKSFKNYLKELLPESFIPVFIRLSGIPEEKKCNQVTAQERAHIMRLLTDFRLTVTKTRPIAEAIITRGGVSLSEINPHTMESKIVKGLFFCGEVIDIDGITGGYNLQAAFSTAFLAAREACPEHA